MQSSVAKMKNRPSEAVSVQRPHICKYRPARSLLWRGVVSAFGFRSNVIRV